MWSRRRRLNFVRGRPHSGITRILSNCDFLPAAYNASPPTSIDLLANTTITASVDSRTATLVSLAGRVDIISTNYKNTLQAGGHVSSVLETPFNFTSNPQPGLKFTVDFPIPVLESGLKIKIARKSSYIELICSVADGADWSSFCSFMYPVLLDADIVTAWNIPYLKLDSLPVLDLRQQERLDWLTTHTSMMFSGSERSLRSNPQLQAPLGERTRVEFKDSLFSLFIHYSGLQGPRASVFGITCPTDGGVHISFFVSSLRLDLSNRTVVLDTAVLPLQDTLIPRIALFLGSLTKNGGFCQIRATEAEMRVWKQVLPGLVERTRNWSHNAECEYLAERRVQLSVEKGQKLLCSCGDGSIPSGFVTSIPNWRKVAKYTVRAAISSCFSAAMFEGGSDSDELEKEARENKAKACLSCGRDTAVNGSGLLNCARCQQAKHYFRECQRTDWKKHKVICRAN
ncbi:uncharacterized protein PV07_09436 [Cladophialophora immunda]|uniref:MYND-type domain-containing protein n=1 Tax=Cladophialophora immunda TaxID=569365 RepID=A0A0D1ZEX4_9EURO|nr:uncharacterized protein PV07_09436 [Cladophialophora immunda]KIW26336.1 hypothetical protein PV07_09436 [Cladophialophora immunda]